MTGHLSSAFLTGAGKLSGIVGWPVRHSLSPAIHSYWIQKYQLDAAYVPLPVEPQNLEIALRALPTLGFQGCNITAPHKVEARALVDEETDLAKAVGAINTIFIRDGQLIGGNTDVDGFLDGLNQQAPGWKTLKGHAVLVGAGGAARAVLAGLTDAFDGEIIIANRTVARAEELAKRFDGVRAVSLDSLDSELRGAGLLVNTSTLGMEDGPVLDLELGGLVGDAVVADIVYAPLETTLLHSASRHGLATVDGLGMLLHQAVPGFEGWFGVRPEVDEDLRNYVLAVLSGR